MTISNLQVRRPKAASRCECGLILPRIPNHDRRVFDAIASYIANTQRNEFYLGVRLAGVKVDVTVRKDGTISRFSFVQPGRPLIQLHIRRQTMRPPTTPSKVVVEEIQVAVYGVWLPILTWIQREYGQRDGPNYTLFDWWNSNGKSFRFMDLPRELRDSIYQFTTTPYTWPHIDTRGEFKKHTMVVYNMHVSGVCYRRAPSGHAPPTPTTLPAVSKQVAAEFNHIAQASTISHFIFSHHLLGVIGHPKMANCLRRISLGFPNWIYLRFIGYKGSHNNAFEVLPSPPTINLLRHIDTLEHVNFHFHTVPTVQSLDHPDDSRYLCSWDPWLRFGQEEIKTKVSCQKLFVDMFLLFALDHVRHVPKVTLTGHVKNSTREDWDRTRERERKGEQRDTSDFKAWLWKRPREYFPIDCHCKNSCNYWLIQGPLPEGCEKPEYSPHDWNYDPVKHDPFIYED
ncbi:hypothetical protein G6011_05998 [Alternaria panax]|uniref:Uncharacterized protein n=1 Tax=Alternaria panax TaxID=48097 RepID=A0AAD4FFI8_9PLEO|nr:hypothetical protein G6011_05998 [Alternaria panax]